MVTPGRRESERERERENSCAKLSQFRVATRGKNKGKTREAGEGIKGGAIGFNNLNTRKF